MKIVSGRYPYDGLRYPKSDEKPPFQTRQESERQLPGLHPQKQAELWAALYLTLPEVERLLVQVNKCAAHPWIYPLVATAAHTGARKGELLRMRVTDVDFSASVIVIREKKRRTTAGRRGGYRFPPRAGCHPDRMAHGPSRRPVPVRPGRARRAEQEA